MYKYICIHIYTYIYVYYIYMYRYISQLSDRASPHRGQGLQISCLLLLYRGGWLRSMYVLHHQMRLQQREMLLQQHSNEKWTATGTICPS